MKEIDINNEEEILKECNFDYFYNCDDCSRELCMFYNDILKQKEPEFDKRQALIDLMRIAITINKKSNRIKDMGCEIEKYKNDYENSSKLEKLMSKERQYCLDNWRASEQDKISFCIEQLNKVKELCKKKFAWWENSEWEGNIYDKSDVSNAYFDIEANIDNQIEELKKVKI